MCINQGVPTSWLASLAKADVLHLTRTIMPTPKKERRGEDGLNIDMLDVETGATVKGKKKGSRGP
jgi:hypothetical protein